MKPYKTFRVLISLDLSSTAGRQKLAGIHRFLAEGYDWDFQLLRTREELSSGVLCQAAEDGVDGFLMAIPETTELHRLHAKLRIPVAFIDYPDNHLLHDFPQCVFIMDNTNEICRIAANAILSSGTYKSYCYAEAKNAPRWSRERGDRFIAELLKHNIKAVRLDPECINSREKLSLAMKDLERPAVILAAQDDTASTVIEMCKGQGIAIPSEIAVLGIGNDEDICLHTKPTLSSVAPDFSEEGYRAARELQALMIGRQTLTRRMFYCGNIGLAERKSTKRASSVSTLAHDALAFIGQNALRGISAQDVVKHLHVSRRLADLRFREATGTSMQQAILERRTREICRLLTSTSLPISIIAVKCGYRDANYLKTLFRRRFGMSMREYRNHGASGRLREPVGTGPTKPL